jgi:tetratricopeptide (TPR) repeat protein
MPSTINGIGTRYVGKRSLTTRQGVCEKCGREAELKSYDTRLWVCVLFIPIIPLGRKHVTDECPRCTAHRVGSLDQWQQGVHETLKEATREAQESPNDVEAHLKLHGALHWFGKRGEALQLAEALPGMFPDSADVHVHLGSWYYELGDREKERSHLERALEIDPECRPARKALAVALAGEGNMDRARQLVGFALEPGPDLDARLCIIVAGGHVAGGQPEPAIELFERALGAQPSLGQDAGVRKGVKECEKALGRSPSILPAHAGRRRVAAVLAAMAVLTVAILAGVSLWKRGNQTLHIVNGLGAPVQVGIDGGPQQQVGRGWTGIPLGEGDHTALITMPDGRQREVPFSMRNGFGQRLAGGNMFILNVAGAGTIVAYEVVYTDRPQPGRPPESHTYWGDEFVALHDIDYPLEVPPKSISVSSSSGEVRKWSVELVRGEPLQVIQYALADAPVETQLDFVEHHLGLDPEDEDLLTAYFTFATQTGRTSRCRDFLSAELATRPVRGKWHGFYQQCCLQAGDLEQVEEQYRQMLAEEPDSGILAYLAARVSSDADESARLVDQALEADPEITGAWAYKGMMAASQGALEDARELLETARGIDPDRMDVNQLLFRVRFALGEYEALENELRRKTAAGGDTELAARLHLGQLLGATGQVKKAEAAYDGLSTYLDAQGQGDPYRLRPASRADMCYWTGDWEGCVEAAADLQDAPIFYPVRFWAPLNAGELDAAANCVQFVSGADVPTYLLSLSLAYRGAGEEEKAEAAMEQALVALDQGGYSQQRLARLLRGDGKLEQDLLDGVTDSLICKAVALVVLADEHPEQAQGLLDLAVTLSSLDLYGQRALAPYTGAEAPTIRQD